MLPGAPPIHFNDWDQALTFVAAQAEAEPLVVVLDEFQWLWAAQPALDSIVQRHWDRWERARTPVTLVLSGSALSKMEHLLAPDKPLYGRANYRPLIEPLDYWWAAHFADPEADAEEKLRRYAVLGGTPQYQVWAGAGPILDVIAERILRKGESLYEEPLHLLREEESIRTPGTYFKILHAISAGATKFGEIKNQTGIDSNLEKMLERLEALGYIEHRSPLERTGPVTGRGVYRLRDPFFRFWFRYVFPQRSRLERGRVKDVLAAITDDLDNFMGLAFEDCCRDWLGRYAPDEIQGALTEIGSWWSRDGQTEIDIVGLARRRYALLGACKWDETAPSQVFGRLKRDQETLGGPDLAAKRLVFGRGFDADLKQRARREGAHLISAAMLFETH